jgi:hypothetical protein
MPQYSTEYNASIIDKYNRLRAINEPKIILVGDSNVAFGLDSEKIRQAFNMPVVNFGLHRGLGQTFHSDMIKKHLKEGDIVVIAPAGYEGTDTVSDCVLAWTAIENYYSLWSGISVKNYKDMLFAYPAYLKRAVWQFIKNEGNKPIEGTAYARAAFNEYGDNVFPRPECIFDEERYSSYVYSSNLSQQMRQYWNNYNKYVLSKGAVLYMSCPPILSETLSTDLQFLQNQLNEDLDFPMISQLEDYVYPLEYFYNTSFHLNETGKALRTEQFINDLKIAVNN